MARRCVRATTGADVVERRGQDQRSIPWGRGTGPLPQSLSSTVASGRGTGSSWGSCSAYRVRKEQFPNRERRSEKCRPHAPNPHMLVGAGTQRTCVRVSPLAHAAGPKTRGGFRCTPRPSPPRGHHHQTSSQLRHLAPPEAVRWERQRPPPCSCPIRETRGPPSHPRRHVDRLKWASAYKY